jgi:hypothetical protein
MAGAAAPGRTGKNFAGACWRAGRRRLAFVVVCSGCPLGRPRMAPQPRSAVDPKVVAALPWEHVATVAAVLGVALPVAVAVAGGGDGVVAVVAGAGAVAVAVAAGAVGAVTAVAAAAAAAACDDHGHALAGPLHRHRHRHRRRRRLRSGSGRRDGLGSCSGLEAVRHRSPARARCGRQTGRARARLGRTATIAGTDGAGRARPRRGPRSSCCTCRPSWALVLAMILSGPSSTASGCSPAARRWSCPC